MSKRLKKITNKELRTIKMSQKYVKEILPKDPFTINVDVYELSECGKKAVKSLEQNYLDNANLVSDSVVVWNPKFINERGSSSSANLYGTLVSDKKPIKSSRIVLYKPNKWAWTSSGSLYKMQS